MVALPKRLVVSLAEDNENNVALVRSMLDSMESIRRLIVLPDSARLIAYLQGRGRFSDRLAWPRPGVLILSQHLPGMPGLDVLRWLRAEPRLGSLPVVVLSEGLSPAEDRLADRFNAVPCAKPLDPLEWMPALTQAIGEAINLVQQAWFGSRSAYAPSERVEALWPAEIRVWT